MVPEVHQCQCGVVREMEQLRSGVTDYAIEREQSRCGDGVVSVQSSAGAASKRCQNSQEPKARRT